ncbi:proline-rich protein 36-like isoform X2 [Dermacentor albipictus]|uniref:proline-rich protein 36-like isoform X2 n=1 Tax=Dermacentor albipictus TaxID=60249 RepID=UPI0038FC50FC
MQVLIIALIGAALPATISAAPQATSICLEPCLGRAPAVYRRVTLAPPTLPLAPPATSVISPTTRELPASATSGRSPTKDQRLHAPTCGLGGCATIQSTKLLLFNMQVLIIALIGAALPATISAAPKETSICLEPCLGRAPAVYRRVTLAPPTLPLAPHATSVISPTTRELPASATSGRSPTKDQRLHAPTCGLGGCATIQSTKLLLFNMQVLIIALIGAALPATISAAPQATSICLEPCLGRAPAVYRRVTLAPPTLPLAPPATSVISPTTRELPASATSGRSPTKDQRLHAPTCGLGGCATIQSTKLLLFNMQVLIIALIGAALPATISAAPKETSICLEPCLGRAPAVYRRVTLAPPTLPLAPHATSVISPTTRELPASATSGRSPTKDQRLHAPTCGLGGCATIQSTKLLLFNMQSPAVLSTR